MRYLISNSRSLGQAELITPAIAPDPAPVAVPQPRWIQTGSYDLLPTLAAVGTIAVLTGLGLLFLNK